jgi:hypothetical protein
MREIPILYSTPMIQAKLAGRKTQTRRIIKESFNGCWTNGGPHPCPNEPVVVYPGETYESPCHPGESITIDAPQVQAVFHCSTLDAVAKCPYGKPGDLLWARETWGNSWHRDSVGGTRNKVVYKADGTELQEGMSWKPSIHMPKNYARIWDRIVSIRVERIQDISEEDAIAEGIEPLLMSRTQRGMFGQLYRDYSEPASLFNDGLHPVDSYRSLWIKINGAESWESNTWVWVITTETVSLTGKPENV